MRLEWVFSQNDSGTRLKWGWNDCFLRGKSSHFCPPAPSVPTSFGGRSNSSSLSRTMQNDHRTRNAVRMTGTKTGTTRRRGPFDPRSRPFGSLSPTLVVVPTSIRRSVKRGPLIVPSRSEIKRQRNETISVFEAFHLRTFLMSRALKRHWNDDQMALEWCWNEIGMTNWDNNGMTAQWCENDFESSLGSVNWSIYFHYSLVSHHPQSTPFSSTTIAYVEKIGVKFGLETA